MLLLVALGAVTGLALGVVLAERTGGLDGFKTRVRKARRHRQVEEHDEPALGPAGSEPAAHFGADSEPQDDDDYDYDDGDYPVVLRSSVAHRPDEEELEARVLEVFRNDPTLSGRAIDIGAIGGGTIELTGWVHSDDELAYALTLAGGVPDVVEVMNSLTIRSGSHHARVGQPPADR